MTINKNNVISEYYQNHDIEILTSFLENNQLDKVDIIILMQKLIIDEHTHLPEEHHNAMMLLFEKEEEISNLFVPHIKLYEHEQDPEKTPTFLSAFAFQGSYIHKFKSFFIAKKIKELLPKHLAINLEKNMLHIYKENIISLSNLNNLPCFEKEKREVFNDIVIHLIDDVKNTYYEKEALDIFLEVLKEKLIGLTYLFHNDDGVIVNRYEIKDIKFRKTDNKIIPLIINHNNQEVLFKNAELDCWKQE